jgi:hypothetical protein
MIFFARNALAPATAALILRRGEMKKCLTVLLFTSLALRGDMEFSGFFITSKESLFVITDTESKRSSGWLKIGQSFSGYTVMSFDRNHEMLTLGRGDRSLELPLRASKTEDGKATISGTITLLNGEAEAVKASLFLDEEAMFPLKDGAIFYLKPESRPDGSILYHARITSRKPDGKEETFSFPRIVALPGASFGVRSTDPRAIRFEFKP